MSACAKRGVNPNAVLRCTHACRGIRGANLSTHLQGVYISPTHRAKKATQAGNPGVCQAAKILTERAFEATLALASLLLSSSLMLSIRLRVWFTKSFRKLTSASLI